MKTFFKIDFYTQILIFFGMIIFLQGKDIDLGILNQLGVIFYIMLYSAFFYAPILSVIYIFDIKKH